MQLSYKDVDNLAQQLADKLRYLDIKSVYPIIRGGVLPASIVARLLNIPLAISLNDVVKPYIVVDDILDSGATMSHYSDADFKAVLVSKRSTADIISVQEVEPTTWVTFPWEIGEEQEDGIQDNIRRILQFIGEDPKRQGLLDTPKRVQKAYQEFFAGYKQDPREILSKEFDTSYDQMVVLKNIEFFSSCEHHMLPFFGTVSIAYIPVDKVVGISKLARLVEVYARRLQIQEQMTDQIANAIEENLHPQGVAVKITAKHFCMITRGVQKQNSEMVTTRVLGAFREDSKARHEFLEAIK